MRIVFVSNYFNHHQKPVCDAFYAATGGEFHFIETTEFTAMRKKMGYKEIYAPYTLKCNDQTRQQIKDLIFDADVVITDAEYLDLTQARYDAGKLTFRYAERLFKSRLRYLKSPVHALKAYKTRNMKMLCSSAFTACDFHLMGFYKGATYKWGYFPERTASGDKEKLVCDSVPNSMLWVGRMIGWKHPEAVIYVAEKLKKDGYSFVINIIGNGEMEDWMRRKVSQKGLGDSIHFLGTMAPSEVRAHMADSQILLFTSDEGEGWGAVLNEAMNSGCVVVASDRIGSAPFLVKNRVNGLLFRSRRWNDLYEKVKYLLDNPELRKQMAREALNTIENTWNEEKAVRNFITLATSILNGTSSGINEGPCSQA